MSMAIDLQTEPQLIYDWIKKRPHPPCRVNPATENHANAALIVLLRNATPELIALIEAAKISGELAPRVPDGNKFGYPRTIANPVLKALLALDAKVGE